MIGHPALFWHLIRQPSSSQSDELACSDLLTLLHNFLSTYFSFQTHLYTNNTPLELVFAIRCESVYIDGMKNNCSRKIILIRHGELAKPGGPLRCVSDTDYPLTDYGRLEAAKTAIWLRENAYDKATIVSSPLTRCVETAGIISAEFGRKGEDIRICENIREISCGHWENMTFDDIRKQYPEEFEARGKAFSTYEIPGGENFVNAGRRFGKALAELTDEIAGDIIVVAHAGVFRGFLMELPLEERVDLYEYHGPDSLFAIPQPYAGITILNDKLEIELLGYKPLSHLDNYAIDYFYEQNNVPAHIIKHMNAVADYQDVLLDRLESHDMHFNRELLHKAAVLHDIRRLDYKHAYAGAKYIRGEGYAELASLIANHHEALSVNGRPSGSDDPLTEADILYYVDKRVQEDKLVTIEKRFADSRHKIHGQEAEAAFQAQLDRSYAIEKSLREILGDEMI